MRMSGRVMTLAWGVGMAWTGAAGLLWSESGPAPAGAIDKSHVRPATDEELRAVVGYCWQRCYDVLGPCVGWDQRPCYFNPETQECKTAGGSTECHPCSPANISVHCPGSGPATSPCTPASVRCNPTQQVMRCIHSAGGCQCKEIPLLSAPCGLAGASIGGVPC